ncbi:minor tail protein [Arthrobacter phage Mimi]|nr:minor tail protein [Arthrobacter phage Mimi]
MRRAQFDKYSQAVRNLATNPSFETANGTVTTHTNLAQNPSFETTSGTVDVRTNLCTNPAFETAPNTSTVRTNLAVNPSFEGVSGVTNVRTNLVAYPSFELGSGSTMNYRINLFNGSSQQVGSGATNTTGISYRGSTWNRLSTTSDGHGWRFNTNTADLVNGSVYAFQIELANDGASAVTVYLDWCDNVISGGTQVIQPGERRRVTVTGSRATYDATYKFADVALGLAGTNILWREPLVEKDSIKGQYFDGATTPSSYNYAREKTVTGSASVVNPQRIVDGGTDNIYAQIADGLNCWVQVDLGSVVMLDTVKVWHYNFDGRSYNGTKTEVSADGTNWFTLYDSAASGTYVETSAGKTHTFATRGVRYIRDWLNGSTSNTGNHWLEIQAFNLSTTDFTYGWFGSPNTSTSYTKFNGVAGWAQLGTIYQSDQDPKFGTKCAALLTNGANGDGLWPGSNMPVVGGRTYTYSAWVRATSAHALSFAFRWTDAANASTGADTIVVVTSQLVLGSWARVTASAVAPAGTTQVQMMSRIYETHTPTTIYYDGMTFVEGSIEVPYFDGATAASGDFTYAWAGTANSSSSYQQAPTITTWLNRWYGSTGGNGALYQAKGGISGTYARKLWVSSNTGAAMDVGINTPNTSVSPNTAYTLSMWVRSSVAQVLNPYIDWKDSGSVFISSTTQGVGFTLTPNTWTRISITATSPSNAAFGVFTLTPYNGAIAMPAGSTLDFDNVLIEASPILRDYFDASNPIQNMVNNPSFETNTTGWGNGPNWSINQTGANSYFGTKSLGITRTNTTAGNGYVQFSSGINLNAGATYTLSFYVFGGAGNYTIQANGAATNNVKQYVSFSAPGSQWQRKSLTFTAASTGSCAVYLTDDSNLSPASGTVIWLDGVLLEKSSNLNQYYEGTGDFTYSWSGVANASNSVQSASGFSTYGGANQAVMYRTGTASGSYLGRIFFTGNTITDSGMNFLNSITLAASKSYTVSVTLTSDVTRSVKFSAQGTGTVNQNSANISLTGGVPTRVSWTFATTATAPTGAALYLLRADLVLGTLDVDHMLIEEGTYQIGGYFDGARVDQNLIPVTNFEVDTSNWWPNTGTPTVSSSTDRAFIGTRSLKAVSTIASSDVAVVYSVPLKPLTTYSLSWWVYSDVTRTACYVDIAGTSFNVARAGERSVTAGAWTKVSTTFTTPQNNTGNVAFYFHNYGGPAVVGSTVYLDAVLLEESTTVNQYYEGAGDFTYAWTGTAHASTSVQRGVAAVRLYSERAYGVSTTRNGDKVIRVIPAVKGNGGGYSAYVGNDVFVNLSAQVPTLKANTVYTAVVNYQIEAPLSAGPSLRFNIDGIDQGSGAYSPAVGDYTVNWQFTTGAGAVINFMRFMPGPSGVPGYTNEVILKNVMIVEGPYSGKYFDGTTPAETDFSYFWTGTAHGSTSYRRGTGIAGFTTGNSLAVQSSEWSASGTKSMRITPTMTYNTTSAIVIAPPLEKGKTYTALATRRLAAPITGTLSGYYGTISVVQTDIGTVYSPVLPNVAGVAQARLTFKLDPNVTTWTLRLGHGGAEGSGDVWWDNLTIVEGEYTGDHITGDNPFSRWEGAPKASTSLGYPTQFLDIAGKPSNDILGSSADTGAISVDGFAARTIYLVYESTDMSPSWQAAFYYGTGGSNGLTFQTGDINQNYVYPRADFSGGTSNGTFGFNGGRASGRHVLALSFPQGLATVTGNRNAGPDVTRSFTPGPTGWTSGRLNSVPRVGVSTVRAMVFYQEHDFNTRQAISRYLGNKYGAPVA